MYFPLFVGSLCLSLFCYALLCVHSSFAIILKRKRKLVVLLLLSYRCIVTVDVVWLFLTQSWVDLQCVIVVFPDHTHLPFDNFLRLIFTLEKCKISVMSETSGLCILKDTQVWYPVNPVLYARCTCPVIRGSLYVLNKN